MSSARPKKTLKSKDKRREKGKEKEKVRDKIPANHLVHGGEFDWDKLHNKDDLELWIIRVPEAVSILCSLHVIRSTFACFCFAQISSRLGRVLTWVAFFSAFSWRNPRFLRVCRWINLQVRKGQQG